MTRRIERFTGIAAGLIGAAMLVFALYGPTGSTISTETRSDGTTVTTTGRSSLVDSQDLSVILILFLIVLAVALFGVAFGARAHAATGSPAGYMLLCVSTAVLAFGALLSMFGIGLFFMPSVLLAIIACVAGSAHTSQHQPHDPSHA